jgi:sulfite exporter TauE/SafE
MNTVAAASAFVAGLLSAGHCFGMCGGIVGAFSLGSGAAGTGGRARLQGLLAYNAGRILTYAALGALAGSLGATVGGFLPPEVARRGGRLLAALFLVGLGLFLAGRPQFLQPIERLGARLWRRIEPAGRRFLQARGPGHALALGLVWGFLPCGLVYSMLAMASLAGGAGSGAIVMLSFGAGTLPALFAAGLAASRLRDLARSTLLRRSAAAIYVAAGLWLAFTAISGPGAHGGAHGKSAGAADTCPPQISALR